MSVIASKSLKVSIFFQETFSCLKSLRHESKVLNATLNDGIVVVGCQYGLLVFWNLKAALESSAVVVDINHQSCVKILSEHSGAIPNVVIDGGELITDDYDGVVILRKMNSHSEIRSIFHPEKYY